MSALLHSPWPLFAATFRIVIRKAASIVLGLLARLITAATRVLNALTTSEPLRAQVVHQSDSDEQLATTCARPEKVVDGARSSRLTSLPRQSSTPNRQSPRARNPKCPAAADRSHAREAHRGHPRWAGLAV